MYTIGIHKLFISQARRKQKKSAESWEMRGMYGMKKGRSWKKTRKN
jgi:hypothetical protein